MITMSSSSTTTSTPTDSGRGYHNVATGNALVTVKSHEKEADIILFGANFCPFVQRVWVAFEFLGIPYKVFSVPDFPSYSPSLILTNSFVVL